jgi:TolA-binding protein
LPETAEKPAEPNEELRLYRRAHDAHLKQRDWASAAALYGEYLRRFPRGGLRAEAAYNQALCLIRSGNRGAAKALLQPFAEGAYGDYRRREARSLLEALDPESD